MAYLALFVALGGSSYAAVQLSKGDVKRKHIAKNAIDSERVKNGSLRSRDFKPGHLPAGAQGPKGDPGPIGPTGATGPVGPSTGPAGGDLSGSYPNPTLRAAEAKIPAFPSSNIPGCGDGHFTDFGAPTNPAGFYKDRAGIVHLEGLVTPDTNVTGACGGIFVLPPGYRPAAVLNLSTLRSDTAARVTIDSAGVVRATGTTASTAWVTLDNLSFRAAN